MATLKRAAIAAAIGAAITIAGAVLDPARALRGYLFAYCAVATIAAGGLLLLLIGYAAGARWLAPLRRVTELLALAFPLLALLFLPIAVGHAELYPWADPRGMTEHELHLLELKRAWLNPTGFVLRSALYLAVFIVAAELLRRWSVRRDSIPPTGPDPDAVLRRERRFASAMLPVVGLALTFAAFDWLMSLQPLWFSTMFGVYVFAGGFAGAIALASIIASRVQHAAITPHHFHALGRLLLAFVVFWAYTSYFQGFLIQIANRPIEVTFFLDRLAGGWRVVLIAVVLAQFALPFLLLLPRRLKLRPRYVAAVAGIVLAGHVLDIYWLAIPPEGAHWVDLAALAAVAGACVAFAAWRQRGIAIVPPNDPLVPAGAAYRSPT